MRGRNRVGLGAGCFVWFCPCFLISCWCPLLCCWRSFPCRACLALRFSTPLSYSSSRLLDRFRACVFPDPSPCSLTVSPSSCPRSWTCASPGLCPSIPPLSSRLCPAFVCPSLGLAPPPVSCRFRGVCFGISYLGRALSPERGTVRKSRAGAGEGPSHARHLNV